MALDFDRLVDQLAALQITDDTRPSKRLVLPRPELVTEFEVLACHLLRKKLNGSKDVRQRRIKATFGVPPIVIAKLWELLEDQGSVFKSVKKHHLLWALMYCKIYTTESTMTSTVGCADEKNFREWVWYFIEEVSNLEPIVVCISFIFCISLVFANIFCLP